MLKYDLSDLTKETADALAAKQADVDAEIGREAQYIKATVLFKNKAGPAFTEVREKLKDGGPIDGACYYCERDRYRDIEHVWPKRHYPERAFRWENYVYSCAICNQDRKRDTFGIIVDGATTVTTFNRSLAFDENIPAGKVALLDVRSEDPMDYLKLDLETGNFVPVGDAIAQLRGAFTRDLFNLDDASLSRVRRQQVETYRYYFERCAIAVNTGDLAASSRLFGEIKELPHRTVLMEMKRQSDEIAWLKPLKPLLDIA